MERDYVRSKFCVLSNHIIFFMANVTFSHLTGRQLCRNI